jgi:hypothetical protein
LFKKRRRSDMNLLRSRAKVPASEEAGYSKSPAILQLL